MRIRVDSPAEAFFSIGLMVLAADKKLSREECRSVFDSMISLDVFEGHAGHEARRFLGEILGASEDFVIHNSGAPCDGDALVISEDMVTELIAAAETMLSPTLRKAALAWAVDLALADGFEERERAMLHRLARELEVDGLVID